MLIGLFVDFASAIGVLNLLSTDFKSIRRRLTRSHETRCKHSVAQERNADYFLS
jgi:hypothetical protein